MKAALALVAVLGLVLVASADCVPSPLGAFDTPGTPTLVFAGWDASKTNFRVKVSLPETNTTSRNATADAFFKKEANNTIGDSLGYPVYNATSCALVWDVIINSTDLLKNADHLISADKNWHIYNFSVYVVWTDDVLVKSNWAAYSEKNVTKRNTTSALRFTIYIQRLVSLVSPITLNIYKPEAFWAIVQRTEIIQDVGFFTASLVLEFRVNRHFNVTLFNISEINGNISSAHLLQLLPNTYDATGQWLSYHINVELTGAGACHFSPDTSFTIVFNATTVPFDSHSYPGSITVNLGDSEANWCSTEELPDVLLYGSQASYYNTSYPYEIDEFYVDDVVIMGAHFWTNASLNVTPGSTEFYTPNVTISGGNLATPIQAPNVTGINCPAGSGLHSCWTWFSDHTVIPAYLSYTVTATYQVHYEWEGNPAKRSDKVATYVARSHVALKARPQEDNKEPAVASEGRAASLMGNNTLLAAAIGLAAVALVATAVAVGAFIAIMRRRSTQIPLHLQNE